MGWKIVNGFKIIANLHCTVNDILNMFILDGGKTHHADLPRQVHIKKGKHIHHATPNEDRFISAYFLRGFFITMFLLRPTFLTKTLFTSRLINE